MIMAKVAGKKLSEKAFRRMWVEVRKDPHFIKEMKMFVKASMHVYKLD